MARKEGWEKETSRIEGEILKIRDRLHRLENEIAGNDLAIEIISDIGKKVSNLSMEITQIKTGVSILKWIFPILIPIASILSTWILKFI